MDESRIIRFPESSRVYVYVPPSNPGPDDYKADNAPGEQPQLFGLYGFDGYFDALEAARTGSTLIYSEYRVWLLSIELQVEGLLNC